MTNRCESCANRRISICELSRIRVNPSANRRISVANFRESAYIRANPVNLGKSANRRKSLGNPGESWRILGSPGESARKCARIHPRIRRECVRICVNFRESAANARMGTARIVIRVVGLQRSERSTRGGRNSRSPTSCTSAKGETSKRSCPSSHSQPDNHVTRVREPSQEGTQS